MALNYVFSGLFIFSFLFGCVQFVQGDTEIFSKIINGTWKNAEVGIGLCIYLAGIITLFQGLMTIGEKGGVIGQFAKILTPFFKKIFPEIPEGHPAFGSIMMNFSANALNLGNAATPFGLKAMNQLQELNPDKETASNSQIMFLVLNTSGLTIIPVAIMALRNKYGSADPADVFIPVLLTTFCSSIIGLLVTSLIQKINLFNKVVITYLAVITSFMTFFMFLPTWMEPSTFKVVLSVGGSLLLFIVILYFIVNGLFKKINVYSTFIDGAKEGVNTGLKIAPYLIGILVAIGVFRDSGGLAFITNSIESFLSLFTEQTDFVKALPVGLIRPLSGSGAEGCAIDVFETYGVDSFVGHLASLLQGSSETTFYVLAVYFGSVGIKNTRYALGAGLAADFAGLIAAITISYLFFG